MGVFILKLSKSFNNNERTVFSSSQKLVFNSPRENMRAVLQKSFLMHLKMKLLIQNVFQMQLDQNEPQLSVNHQINLGGVVHDPRVPPPQPSIPSQQQPTSKHLSNGNISLKMKSGSITFTCTRSDQFIFSCAFVEVPCIA